MKDGEPRLSPESRGYVWASKATSIGFQAIGPIGLGYWFDVSWKTLPVGVIVGAVLGFLVMMLEVVRLTKSR